MPSRTAFIRLAMCPKCVAILACSAVTHYIQLQFDKIYSAVMHASLSQCFHAINIYKPMKTSHACQCAVPCIIAQICFECKSCVYAAPGLASIYITTQECIQKVVGPLRADSSGLTSAWQSLHDRRLSGHWIHGSSHCTQPQLYVMAGQGRFLLIYSLARPSLAPVHPDSYKVHPLPSQPPYTGVRRKYIK